MLNVLGWAVVIIALFAFFRMFKMIFRNRSDDSTNHRQELIDEAHLRLPGESDSEAWKLLWKERHEKMDGIIKMKRRLTEGEVNMYNRLSDDVIMIEKMLDEMIKSITLEEV